MKRMLTIFVALLLLAACGLAAAEGDAAQPRVVDMADLFTDAQEAELEARIAGIADAYSFDVAIVSSEDSGGKPANLYAADFFDEHGYGYGERGDGILFAFCLDLGEYFTDTHGYGIEAFTDSGLDELHALMTPAIRDKDYFAAMTIFLTYIPRFLDEAAANRPYDVDNPLVVPSVWSRANRYALPVAVAALVIALLVVLGMKRKLLTAKRQLAAGSYVRDGSLDISEASDIFLYRTVVRRKIEKSSSSGGGSTTFTSSGGQSHGGRGGKL